MKRSNWLFLLALVGSGFSGFLTVSKLVFSSCPLDSACPFFLGYPACMYGFGMFLILLVLTGLYAFKDKAKPLIKSTAIVSGIGVIFGGYFSIKEMFWPDCPFDICIYKLGIPSCIYGWLVFISIFVLAIREARFTYNSSRNHED